MTASTGCSLTDQIRLGDHLAHPLGGPARRDEKWHLDERGVSIKV
ncbi:hypothetical protein [Burkholderia cepacia]|nr:hypothetical protein [Burkholderia cepacia]